MASKVKLGILGSTNGTDMQALIEAIANNQLNAEIVLVVSDKLDSGIIQRAQRYNIKIFIVNYADFKKRSEAEAQIVAELKKNGAELIILIGFMKILTPYFIGELRGRIWNIHPSLLPKYAGGMNLTVHEEVLRNHEKESGCTLHEVVEEVDKGKIIAQKKCNIEEGETPETLKVKVQKLEQECLIEEIQKVSEGKLVIES